MDSDDYSADEFKRKRDGEVEEEIFRKSKRIQRTPKKGEGLENEDRLDKLMNMIKDLITEVKEIRREQQEYREGLKILKEENAVIRKENEELKNVVKGLNTRMEQLDKKSRKNNIIVTGLEIDANDGNKIKENISSFMQQNLEIKVEFKEGHKIGPKICVLEMNCTEDKLHIMRNKSKLKNIRGQKVYINNDRTKREREIEKNIRKIANDERQKGKQVKIGYEKLTINGEIWTWNDENEELEMKGDRSNIREKSKN